MRVSLRDAKASSVAACPARPLELSAVQLFRFRVVDDREQVAADTVHRRLDDGEDRGCGDGGIDRVAAILQHLQAGCGGERLARRDHAAATEHDRARGMWVRSRAVARQRKLWKVRWRLRAAKRDEHEYPAGDDGSAFHRSSKETITKCQRQIASCSCAPEKRAREAFEHLRQRLAGQGKGIELRRPREFIAP